MTEKGPTGARWLMNGAALLWGLQFSILVPSLGLILSFRYEASPAEVGSILAAYNTAGFLAALLIPGWADRRALYLEIMFVCACAGLALAIVFLAASSIRSALLALIFLGAPAGVGSSLLFAHLRATGAAKDQVVRLRAIVSTAWVLGPPLATGIVYVFEAEGLPVMFGGIAILNMGSCWLLLKRHRAGPFSIHEAGSAQVMQRRGASLRQIILINVAFIALQATNASVVALLGLYVSESLRLPIVWAGVALAIAAAAEVPALLLVSRLSRFGVSDLKIVTGGSILGIIYYVGLTSVASGVALLALQLLNALFFAAVAGAGLSLYQDIFARPGFAVGMYANTRRLGAIASGGLIAISASGTTGYGLTFTWCAALTSLALILLLLVRRLPDCRNGHSADNRS